MLYQSVTHTIQGVHQSLCRNEYGCCAGEKESSKEGSPFREALVTGAALLAANLIKSNDYTKERLQEVRNSDQPQLEYTSLVAMRLTTVSHTLSQLMATVVIVLISFKESGVSGGKQTDVLEIVCVVDPLKLTR